MWVTRDCRSTNWVSVLKSLGSTVVDYSRYKVSIYTEGPEGVHFSYSSFHNYLHYRVYKY
jgi:hypothetical protein